MAQQYASQQPAGFNNHVEKVAIIGASGNMGKFITEAFLQTGKHTVTAITRHDSKNTMPSGVKVAKVDYSSQESLVSALKGHDALIVTMSVHARDSLNPIIDAASTAGVLWILPNYFSGDSEAEEMQRDNMLGESHQAMVAYIKAKGNLSFVELGCGFWYEHSLCSMKFCYGFDAEKREALFYDDGNTKIITSTWPQCGKAVAKLFSLPVLPDDENDKRATLSQFRNRAVYVSSFLLSQKDMFESLLRVTGTQESEWKIEYQPVHEVFAEGKKLLGEGNWEGFGKCLYSRTFYKSGEGDFTSKLNNEALGLKTDEDLDEATKAGVELQKSGYGY